MKTSTFVMAATLAALSTVSAGAADLVKVAIGQRGLWDSAIVELGRDKGIFAKHGVTTEIVYTAGGGETQQAVISGSVDIGISAGTLGVLSAFAKGAPVRIIAGEATGTAEYYFVRADSVVQKAFKGVKPTMTLAYSTAGSGTHITALRFMKEYGFEAQLVKTGTVPATFTQVMSGQVDIGFSTPPVGLEAAEEGRIRIIALANDLASIRTQTVRVTIANAYDLAKRPAVYARFIQAYRETIDWMYFDDAAINAFAKWADITPIMARRVRDGFYPKEMLQLDNVSNLDGIIQDAIAFKYIAQPLSAEQIGLLLQLPGAHGR
jgi:ABC-type nitrate/sulfonate/bicarbonate transport system substrate-binding protein